MNNDFSVARDTLAMVRQIARGMWRYRWRAAILTWIVCLLGWFVVLTMPDTYKASARIYVDTENAIRPLLQGIALPTDVMSEVAIVTREMLSRPNLAQVARETDLHLRARTEEQFEGLLSSLQKRIQVQGSRENIYTIEFEDKDRDKALAVVGSLVDTFVEQSLGANRDESSSAQEFLEKQIAEYERRLTEAEDRLARFKRENFAFMPDKNGDYFGRLQAARSELADTQQKLRLAQQKRNELTRQLEGEEPVFGIMGSTSGTDQDGQVSTGRIAALEQQLDELRLRYTDKHPQIIEILETIRLLREEERARAAAAGPSAPDLPLISDPLDLNPVYQNIRIQLSNLEVEIAELRARQSDQSGQVNRLTQLVDTIPQVEAELGRLNRDYGIVQAKYEQLVQQLETASIGEEADESLDEVQFRIIDPPYSAFAPTGPNRPLFLTMVLLFASGVGGAVAFAFNMLNPVLFDPRAVSASFDLPVLGVVSLFETRGEHRRRIFTRWKFAFAMMVLVVVFVGIVQFSDQAPRVVKLMASGAGL